MTPAHQHFLIVTLLLSLIATINSRPIEDDGTSTIAAPTYYNNDNDNDNQRPRNNPKRRGGKRKLIIEKEDDNDDMSIYDITPFPTPSPPPPPPSSLPTPPPNKAEEDILNMIPSPTYFPLPTHLPTSSTAAIIDGNIDDNGDDKMMMMMMMMTPTQTTSMTSETNNNQEYYESMLSAIDNWCIVPNGSKRSSYNNNNCQCPNPLIPTGRYLTNGWYEQFLHNVNIAQQIAADTTASNTNSSTSSSNNNNNNNNEQQQLLDIVFMGDSITEQRQGTRRGTIVPSYTPIKATFEQTFQLSPPQAAKSNKNQTTADTKKYNAIALGIQGDTTTNLQWRIQHAKYLTTITPKIWWIGIGTNNILKYSCSEDVIVLGIRHIVEEILRVQKKKNENDDDVIVVINSLLPVQNNNEGLLSLELDDDEETANIEEATVVESNNVTNSTNNTDEETRGENECNRTLCYNTYPHIHSINTKLRQYAMNTPNVHYFNADSIFIEERDAEVHASSLANGNGEVVKKKKKQKYMKLDLFDDPVHPNLRGHKEWNKMILKHLYYLLG